MWYDICNPKDLMNNDSLEESILLDNDNRIFILQGESMSGKTHFLKHMKCKNTLRVPANLFREAAFYPGDLIFKEKNIDLLMYFLIQIYDLEVFSIEHVDLVMGPGEGMQVLYSEIVASLATRYRVIITGEHFTSGYKSFLSGLPKYRHFKYYDQSVLEG